MVPSVAAHTREQTVVFNEEEPAGHVGLVFHTKPELMHILDPAVTACFTGRRPYFALHSSGIKGNNLASSCSPPLLRLCADFGFGDQRMSPGVSHKAS